MKKRTLLGLFALHLDNRVPELGVDLGHTESIVAEGNGVAESLLRIKEHEPK